MKLKHQNAGTKIHDYLTTFIKSLMDSHDFTGAVDCYNAHKSEISEAGGAWAGEILLMVSRAFASQTLHSQALKTARTAQIMAAQDNDSILLADIFLHLGKVLRDLGQVKEARKAFQDAESIYRRQDQSEGQSLALNQLAGLYFSVADYQNALRYLMEAVEIAKMLGDKKSLAFMMGNIGRIYTFSGNLNEAENHIRLNIELSTELEDSDESMRAELSLAYVQMQKAEYNQAEQSLKRARTLLESVDSKRDEAIYWSYMGELRMRTKAFDQAQEALSVALNIAETISVVSTLAGRILKLQAELYCETNNYRLAARFASKAMVIAQNASNKVEMGAILRIKARIADCKSVKKEAIDQYKKSIDLLDESGVRFEKAETLMAAGQSNAFSNRVKMTYLFRAEEFYSQNRIVNRLNEVSRLISKIESFDSKMFGISSRTKTDSSVEYLTSDKAIKRFIAQMPRLGETDLPLLITGETGVGKDHIARLFHSIVRPENPYVAINCASVPDSLLESELFGYKKGAFTGADGNKDGLFVTANGGVLLLDEIGDMPIQLQAKLLGVLERRKVLPLGSTVEIDLDLKLVAATNKDIEKMVDNGTFRRDLYYRLSGLSFHLPPLRERKEDISLLLESFLVKRRMLPKDVKAPTELVRQFIAHSWPGNIRELLNKVKRLQVMSELVAEGDLVELSRSLFNSESLPSIEEGTLFDRVEKFEQKLLSEALLAAGGNKSEAARLLGVHEATVRTKLKRYQISLESLEQGLAS